MNHPELCMCPCCKEPREKFYAGFDKQSITIDPIGPTAELKTQLAAVMKERDEWKLACALSCEMHGCLECTPEAFRRDAEKLQAENASLREELRDARPVIEQFVKAYVSAIRGTETDRQDQLRRLERIDAALKDRP